MIKVLRLGKEYEIKYFHHMVHHENLEGILTNGLLSHNEVIKRGELKKDIAMEEVQDLRSSKYIVDPVLDKETGQTVEVGRKVHDYVPFYFNARNPMMYRRKSINPELVILLVDASVINNPDVYFSNGNAASHNTSFYKGQENLHVVPFETVYASSWNHDDPEIKKENVRKRCSEVLIYPSLSVSEIKHIVCPNDKMLNFVNDIKNIESIKSSISHINVVKNTAWFFES